MIHNLNVPSDDRIHPLPQAEDELNCWNELGTFMLRGEHFAMPVRLPQIVRQPAPWARNATCSASSRHNPMS